MKIYNGYERLPRNYTTMIDEYEMTMANGYLMNNKQNNTNDNPDNQHKQHKQYKQYSYSKILLIQFLIAP